ncbi:hypothetical protein HYE59_07360 [Aggregatibacter actinomycetemcomitans]|uniref:hypothetical protein n=1 Tax=Aggregatibacter actinomycetemcomitans TaxID=714 RepID=UPI00197C2E44|nr:hypothetical protein [Aggregatibacter actinomycetemcomitans]MBN6077352.1 hypothetical protein [Aggregatibacter actinomycetemcomitans]
MKKLFWLIPVGLCLNLSACSEKDAAYYLSHIDEAKTKWTQCENDMETAMRTKDKAALEKIMAKGSECDLVRNAIKEDKRLQLEKEKNEREAQKAAEIAKAKELIEQQYGSQSWQEFVKTFVNSKCTNIWGKTPECEAMESLYQEKTQPIIKELKAKGLNSLLNEEQNYCKQDKRRYSACDVWQTAVKEQATEEFQAMSLEQLNALKAYDEDYKKEQPRQAWRSVFKEKEDAYIKQLTENYDQLKEIYNTCVDQVQSAKNWSEKHRISSDYPCRQASSARIRLQLPSDDFQTKME